MRVEQALVALGAAEIESIISEKEAIEVDCHFCKQTYNFNKDELKRLLYEMH